MDSYQRSILATERAMATSYAGGRAVAVGDTTLLKRGIWLYFLLLIFEGGLRRWVLPGLATPLLVVRDPIALWLLVAAWQRGLLPTTFYIKGMVFVSILAIISATLLGHGSMLVALYGARILLFHFPLIFVIGRLFNRADVLKLGVVMLWMAIPMALLIAVQFYSPQSAWVNRGVGGAEGGAGFDGALGFFRPPGTFSFTNGTQLFFALAGAFIFYFWLNPGNINKLILIAATMGLTAAIPFSISRSLLLSVLTTGLFTIIGLMRKPQNLGRIAAMLVGLVAIVGVLSQVSALQTPLDAFASRFTSASEAEGGVANSFVDRFLGGAFNALTNSSQQPFFGYGIGMGTNVGSQLLTGNQSFLIAEGEWGRLIGEMGPLFGIAVILMRVALTMQLTLASYRRLLQEDILPWLLVSSGFLAIPQGQWAQPTSLGFSTLIAGLIIASLRNPVLLPQKISPSLVISQSGN